MGKALNSLTIFFCLLGVVAATLAYGEHYNTKPSPCQINSVWDCGIVNHSAYAVLHGIPIALIGAVGYALLIAFVGRYPWVTFYGALAGLLFSLRFTYVEWRVLEVWCLYCLSSQIIIAIIAVLSLLAALQSRPEWARRHA